MTRLIETLISGLSLGSIYALMALGYTMVYGIAKMLNFAHGDIIMVGAYAVVTSVLTLGMPPLVAILISIAVCALLGITVEFLAYRPLRQAPPLAVLITAIGVSYLLQNLALLIYGSEQKAFPVLFTIPSVELGGVYIDGITIATMAVTAIIMVGLSLFINRTRMGKAMRAVSEDKEAAELMGISVNRTITVTFAIGSALAGVAAIFYGAAYTYIRPFLNRLGKEMPQMPVELFDERFTSKLALQTMIAGGVPKKRRREDKGMVDRISATIILQGYMEAQSLQTKNEI